MYFLFDREVEKWIITLTDRLVDKGEIKTMMIFNDNNKNGNQKSCNNHHNKAATKEQLTAGKEKQH